MSRGERPVGRGERFGRRRRRFGAAAAADAFDRLGALGDPYQVAAE